jgi:TatD DNase family protein
MNVMGPLIDTHCHLAHGRLAGQVQAVLDRAAQAGVVAVICASADLAEARRAQQLAHRHSQVYFTAGLHPHDASRAAEGYLAELEKLAADPRCVALGECGLDYHYDFSPRPAQRRVFAEQLDLARRLGRKLVIHTRQALDDVLAIVRESGLDPRQIVFHSFTEPLPAAQAVLDGGAMIGFSGIVTFAASDPLRQLAAAVPADRLLVETDSPYLAPEPVRKMKTNEPANVVHVAAGLAAVRKTSPDNIAAITTSNAVKFFSLRMPSSLGWPLSGDK